MYIRYVSEVPRNLASASCRDPSTTWKKLFHILFFIFRELRDCGNSRLVCASRQALGASPTVPYHSCSPVFISGCLPGQLSNATGGGSCQPTAPAVCLLASLASSHQPQLPAPELHHHVCCLAESADGLPPNKELTLSLTVRPPSLPPPPPPSAQHTHDQGKLPRYLTFSVPCASPFILYRKPTDSAKLPTMPTTTAETLSLVTRNVSVAPLVLLSVVDHYNRGATSKTRNKRVVGVLLGQNDGKSVRVSNSFAGANMILFPTARGRRRAAPTDMLAPLLQSLLKKTRRTPRSGSWITTTSSL